MSVIVPHWIAGFSVTMCGIYIRLSIECIPDMNDSGTAITSESNHTYRELLSLLTARGVKKYGRTIVSGLKVVPEILDSKPDIVTHWIAALDCIDIPRYLPASVNRIYLSRALFRELDVNGTNHPLLAVTVPDFDSFDERSIVDPVSLLIPFQDPANIGAAVRSAAAFGIKTIVLLKEAAHPYLPKSIRAGGTPLFGMRFVKGPSIADLRGLSRPLIALSAGGSDVRSFAFPASFYLLPGLEGQGIPDSIHTDVFLSIPMAQGVESLNAAVALSIALYEWRCSGRTTTH